MPGERSPQQQRAWEAKRTLIRITLDNAMALIEKTPQKDYLTPTIHGVLQQTRSELTERYQAAMGAFEDYAEEDLKKEDREEAVKLLDQIRKEYTDISLQLQKAVSAFERAHPAGGGGPAAGDGSEDAAPQPTGAGGKFQSLFRPQRLAADESYVGFCYWREKLQTYFEMSNLARYSRHVQYTALFECLDKDLEKRIRMVIPDSEDLPIFPEIIFNDDGNEVPEEDCVLGELENIFRTLNPIQSRRQAFFDAKQRHGQLMSNFISDLDSLARAADLQELSTKQLMVYRIISGCTDYPLRTKILEKVEEPDLDSIYTTVRAYESAKNANKSTAPAAAANFTKQGERRHQPSARKPQHKPKGQSGSGKSRQSQANAASTCCWRCGKDNHTSPQCTLNKNVVCNKCQKKGHIKSACGLPQQKKQQQGKHKQGGKPGRRAYTANMVSHANKAGMFTGCPTPRIEMEFVGKHRRKGQKVKFKQQDVIPDSGASDTIVRKQLVDKYKLQYKPDISQLKVANGEHIQISGTIELEAHYQGAKQVITALVCPDLSPDVLLGWQDCVRLGILPAQFPARVNHVSPEEIESRAAKEHECRITPEECSSLKESMIKEFKDIIRNDLCGEKIKGAVMTINLKPDANIRPIRVSTPRATPLHLKPDADKVIASLLEQKIIERVPANEPSDWCSPAFFVPKPAGKGVRLVTDFKVLNSCVERAPKPFPSTRDIIRNISSDAKVYAKMDAISGFYQIPLAKKSRPYTTFILENGRMRYLAGPMGLNATGDAFCEATDRAFMGMDGTQKIIDDGLVYGNSLKQLEKRLRKVLQKCREYNIILSLDKFDISTKVKFAGHIISNAGVQPDPEKVKAIQDFAAPTDVTQVRSFLGLANQLGYFLPDLAHICQPIHDLLKKNNAFLWGPMQQNAFESVKEVLTSDLIVHPFDPAKQIELYTDASRSGLGYILSQRCTQTNTLQMVRCGSRALTSAETRYAVTELECLAVYYAINHCEFYLQGATVITVITDHRALEGLWRKTLADIPNPRVLRYREKLISFNIVIIWKPGKSNQIADCLSRDPRFQHDRPPSSLEENTEEERLIATVLSAASQVDPNLALILELRDDEYFRLISAIEKECFSEDLNIYKKAAANISVIGEGDDKLLIYDGSRLVIPRRARKQILKALHAAHQGLKKTLTLATRFVYWPNMNQDIENVCEHCNQCRMLKPAQQREPPNYNLTKSIGDMFPMSDVSADLFENAGKDYLVMIDRFSGFPFCTRLHSTTTKAIIDALMHWWSSEGMPMRIRTDGGPQFRKPFDDFCKEKGIVHELTSAHNAAANGLAERGVQSCKHLLIKCLEAKEDFEEALLAWRATPTAKGGPSPAQLFRHRSLKIIGIPQPEASLHYATSEQMADWIDEKQSAFDSCMKALQKSARKNSLPMLNPGDMVDVKNVHNRGWRNKAAIIVAIRHDQKSYVIAERETGREMIRNRALLRKSAPEGASEGENSFSPLGGPKEEKAGPAFNTRSKTKRALSEGLVGINETFIKKTREGSTREGSTTPRTSSAFSCFLVTDQSTSRTLPEIFASDQCFLSSCSDYATQESHLEKSVTFNHLSRRRRNSPYVRVPGKRERQARQPALPAMPAPSAVREEGHQAHLTGQDGQDGRGSAEQGGHQLRDVVGRPETAAAEGGGSSGGLSNAFRQLTLRAGVADARGPGGRRAGPLHPTGGSPVRRPGQEQGQADQGQQVRQGQAAAYTVSSASSRQQEQEDQARPSASTLRGRGPQQALPRAGGQQHGAQRAGQRQPRPGPSPSAGGTASSGKAKRAKPQPQHAPPPQARRHANRGKFLPGSYCAFQPFILVCAAVALSAVAIQPAQGEDFYAICANANDFESWKDDILSACYHGIPSIDVGSPCRQETTDLRNAQQAVVDYHKQVTGLQEQLSTIKMQVRDAEDQAARDSIAERLEDYIAQQALQRKHERELERAENAGITANGHPLHGVRGSNLGPEPWSPGVRPEEPPQQRQPEQQQQTHSALAAAGWLGGLVAVGSLVVAIVKAFRSKGAKRGLVEVAHDPVARENARIAADAARDLARKYSQARTAAQYAPLRSMDSQPATVNLNISTLEQREALRRAHDQLGAEHEDDNANGNRPRY